MKQRLIAALILLSSTSLFAQNTRSFVSSTGLDTNPCSVSAPCRTIPFAYTQTNAGGDIVALDSAGYGPTVTIGRGMNITVPSGVFATMTPAAGATGIVISAGASDIVRIDGLQFLGAGPGNNQTAIGIGTCLRAELWNLKIKSVAYPVKILADPHVFINHLDASDFLTGISLIGVNTNANTSTLKVYVTGSSLIGGTVGVEVDNGAIVMAGSQAGLDGNRIVFITGNSYVFGPNSAGCSQVTVGYYSGSGTGASSGNGNLACSQP